MTTHGTSSVHIGIDGNSIEGTQQLRALQTNIDLLSALVEDMGPLAGISLPELAAEERTRSTVLVHAANETLRGIEVSTETGQAVVDTMSTGRVAELRCLMRRLEEWHYRTVVLLLKLEMAISLSVV